MPTRKATNSDRLRCLAVLRAASGPIVAADLAQRIGLRCKDRETARRQVRAIVKDLRDTGAKIVSNLASGYWLTHDETMWQDYCQRRQIDGKRIIGEASRRGKGSARAAAGVTLFDMTMSAVGR